MFGLATRMLLLSVAGGTTYWTVDDAVEKKAADIKTLQALDPELEEISKSSSVADEHLKGNQSILEMVQSDLDEVKKANQKSLIHLKEQNANVEQAIKEIDAVKEKLQKSVAKAREASAHEKKAKKDLEASERAANARTAEMQKASEAYANAEAHLEAVITGEDPNEIPSAYDDKKDKKKRLEAAQAELKEAEKSKADNSKAVSEAVTQMEKRRFEQQVEQKAFDDASASLRHAEKARKKLSDNSRPEQLNVQSLSQALEVLKRSVDHLTSESNELKRILRQKQRQHDALQRTITDDSHCIESLRSAQGQVQHAANVYNATSHAYSVSQSDDLLEAVWGAKDELDKFRYDLYVTQKKCAPDTFHLPDMAPPPSCEKETGGTCKLLWCDASRNAYCEQATSSCRCPPATCASGGECRPRGSPPLATLPPTAVFAEAAVPESASGSPKILIVVLAVLIGVAAAARQKRSGSRKVILSERLLQ
ncbi:unnamed protein product [Prorocentrum cordatum]|uniref:Uncharacterized protein n=1 Tax=Prorocentrum cordatum TaxID=2364126 RepID=A0ABN9T0J6_9DINO|nr:unnamed protein product [Polarella glacialis]